MRCYPIDRTMVSALHGCAYCVQSDADANANADREGRRSVDVQEIVPTRIKTEDKKLQQQHTVRANAPCFDILFYFLHTVHFTVHVCLCLPAGRARHTC